MIKTPKIEIHKDNFSVSVLSGQWASLSSVTSDIICISRKNKRNKNPDTSIIRQKPIKEPVNPMERAKENTLSDVEKGIPKEIPPLFWHKVDYEDDTNEKAHDYVNYPSKTERCVRKLAKEQ